MKNLYDCISNICFNSFLREDFSQRKVVKSSKQLCAVMGVRNGFELKMTSSTVYVPHGGVWRAQSPSHETHGPY